MKKIGMSPTDEDNHYLLKMYKDYTFLMYVASKRTTVFYYRIKLFLTFFNILLSSAASAANSNFMNVKNDVSMLENRTLTNMNIIIKSGMVINFILSIVMGFMYLFEIAQKELFFKVYADNYMRLNNAITAEMSLNKVSNKEFVKFVLFEYTFLIENAKYDIPSFVRKKIKKQFASYNIPPYLDVYLSKFTLKTKLHKLKEYINIFRNQKNDTITSITVPKNNIISPIIKSYSYDTSITYASQYSHITDESNNEKILSNILVYDNLEKIDNSNVSPILYNFKISSFNPDTYE